MTDHKQALTEELWELFPIVLTGHKAEWGEQYKEMAVVLKEGLASCDVVWGGIHACGRAYHPTA